MNLNKAIEVLSYLRTEEEDDLAKYAKVHALIDGFRVENRGRNNEMINSYVEEKIHEVEIWFQILCGIGEDGWPAEKLRENLINAIYGLGKLITDDGLSLRGPMA
jgi:hypothetical protein